MMSKPKIFSSFQAAYDRAQQEVGKIVNQCREDLVSNSECCECYDRIIDIWTQMTEEITKNIMENISIDTFRNPGQ